MKKSWNRFIHLTHIHLKLILRDKMTLFWFLAFPLILTTLFGFIVPNVGNQSKLVIVSDESYTKDSPVIDKLLSVPNAEWDPGLEPEEAVEQFTRGYLAMAITAEKDQEISLHYRDGQDRELVEVLSNVIKQADSSIEVKSVPYEDIQTIRPIDFILPGMIVLTIMQIGLFGGTTLLMDRNSQTLRRLKTNGVTASEIILSHIFSRILLVIAAAMLLTFVGKYILRANIDLSNWYVILPIAFIAGICFLSMGLLIASMFRSPEAGNIFSQSINFPMAFICGIFFPLSTMPEPLQKFASILPLTPLVETTRNLFLAIEISGMQLMVTVGLLVIWGISSLGLGSILFKWE
ncbi:ABC transporter permease [Metabacillus halosaccharovorans]|uniref:ABC transporter permease n=1 Tax=Bacillaceae TaxID=186817 RepID=UPI00047E0805|nr:MULTISPECIES: ABC transporter permease [Bacillaceae]MCM3440409.1 ABC transporter permease [Metabacillus halosaccharovorans]